MFNVWLHSSFHQLLECFVILTHLLLLFHTELILDTSELTTSSSLLMFNRSEMSIFLIANKTFLMKLASSLLFFAMEYLTSLIFSSSIAIITERVAWSEDKCKSRWIWWLLSSVDPFHKNIRSITEFDLLFESEYLVETQLVRKDSSRLLGVVHTRVEVRRMDSEMSGLVKQPWLQLMCCAVCLPCGHNFRWRKKNLSGSEYWLVCCHWTLEIEFNESLSLSIIRLVNYNVTTSLIYKLIV